MPRRFGLPSVYLAAAVATAAATAVPLAMTPASGLALRPAASEPTRPYIVTARSRVDAQDLVAEVRWRVRRYYTEALPGFATFLTAGELAELRSDRRVLAIEPDRQIHAMPVPGSVAPPSDDATGAGTTVYVVDSGIDVTTEEFGDRAWRAFDATGGAGRDCGGHGTRMARTVAVRAPHARIASVRVLGCAGSGTLADLLAGLDWIRRHARGPSVVALSLDGADSPALGTAVRSLVRSGVFVAGAADSGPCQATPGGQVFSGSAPYLAAAVARRLEGRPAAAPSAVTSWLKCTTTRAAIRQNPSGSSNLLMHSGGH